MLLTPKTPDLEQLYEQKVMALPSALYNALAASEVTRTFTSAMERAGIEENLRGCINMAVLQVFTGDIPPRDLAKTIAEWGPLDEKKAYAVAQHLVENLINKHREYLVNTFGPSYFSPDPNAPAKKPADTTPKLDGNVVNLRST